MQEAVGVMEAVMRGENVQPQPPEYSFTSFEAFRKAMTPQRFALLKVIREKQPESIKELAGIQDMENRHGKVSKTSRWDTDLF